MISEMNENSDELTLPAIVVTDADQVNYGRVMAEPD